MEYPTGECKSCNSLAARVAELEEMKAGTEYCNEPCSQLAHFRAERDRYRAALDRIRLDDLSAFDCKLVAAKAQGLIP